MDVCCGIVGRIHVQPVEFRDCLQDHEPSSREYSLKRKVDVEHAQE